MTKIVTCYHSLGLQGCHRLGNGLGKTFLKVREKLGSLFRVRENFKLCQYKGRNNCFRFPICFEQQKANLNSAPAHGSTPLFGQYGVMLLDRVWFCWLAVLNRTYDFTSICPQQDRNPSKTGYSYNQSKIEMSTSDQKVFMQHQIFCRVRVMLLLSVLFKLFFHFISIIKSTY